MGVRSKASLSQLKVDLGGGQGRGEVSGDRTEALEPRTKEERR